MYAYSLGGDLMTLTSLSTNQSLNQPLQLLLLLLLLLRSANQQSVT